MNAPGPLKHLDLSSGYVVPVCNSEPESRIELTCTFGSTIVYKSQTGGEYWNSRP